MRNSTNSTDSTTTARTLGTNPTSVRPTALRQNTFRDQTTQGVLYCDLEPDSRASTEGLLVAKGIPVIATGNPQIAMALLGQMSGLGVLLLSFSTVSMQLLSLAGFARRLNPGVQIIVVLNGVNDGANATANSNPQSGWAGGIKSGLVDVVIDRSDPEYLSKVVMERLGAS